MESPFLLGLFKLLVAGREQTIICLEEFTQYHCGQ